MIDIKIFLSKIKPMTTSEKAIILDQLAKIKNNSITGECIRIFISNAHLKTDDQIIQLVYDLKSQIADNRMLLKSILGSQFEFFDTLEIGKSYYYSRRNSR